MHDFRRLDVWRESVMLAKRIYAITNTFPASEGWGLTAQLRRAAVSVSSNIAEGSGRASDKEFARFLSIARGSVLEVESQLEVARELGYLADANAITDDLGQLVRKLSSLMVTLAN